VTIIEGDDFPEGPEKPDIDTTEVEKLRKRK
jgi:hypothetical protein